jgi:hypothetical protein
MGSAHSSSGSREAGILAAIRGGNAPLVEPGCNGPQRRSAARLYFSNDRH